MRDTLNSVAATLPKERHASHSNEQRTNTTVSAHSSEMPKVCIVTSSPPGRHGVGQVYIRDMAKRFPGGHFSCAHVPGVHGIWSEETCRELQIPTVTLESIPESKWQRGPQWLRNRVTNLKWNSKTRPKISDVGEHVAAFAREQKSEALLCVLESPVLMAVAARISQFETRPMYTLVWDHPESVIERYGYRGRLLDSLLDNFQTAIQASQHVIVVGEHLRQWMKSRFYKDAIVFRHAIEDVIRPDLMTADETEPIRIGFAGSVTAKLELRLLMEALDLTNWRIGGRDVELHLFGLSFSLNATQARKIVYHGFLHDTADVVKELSRCDVNFLPQSFQPEDELVTNYSFPTKLSTYVAAGRPIFALTPGSSEVAGFWNQFNLGPICQEFDAGQLRDCLSAALVAEAGSSQQEWLNALSRVQSEELTVAKNHEALNQIFGPGSQGDHQN